MDRRKGENRIGEEKGKIREKRKGKRRKGEKEMERGKGSRKGEMKL